MKSNHAYAAFAAVVLALAFSSEPSAAQSWNAWPRDAGWGSVPFLGLGFNWRRPYLVEVPRYVPSPEEIAYCARRYRTYDPISGTYVARNGLRYPCP